MINPKTYLRPANLAEAVEALNTHPGAYPFAGGALVLGTLDVLYETVIDLQAVAELNEINITPEGVHLGSAVMLQSLLEIPEIPVAFKRAITRTIPLNIRNNTSIAESLTVHPVPAEWAALLVAYDARVKQVLHDGNTDEFSIAETTLVSPAPYGRYLPDNLMHSLFIHALAEDEYLGTAHIARTPAGDPIVNAAVVVKLMPDGRVLGGFGALGGVSTDHLVELIALGDLYEKPLTPEYIAAQAAQVPHVLNPPDNYLGSSEYRKTMAGLLIKRALEDVVAQLN